MSGLADPEFAVTTAAGAFGFALFFAKAPDVETAKIARLTTNIFFMLKLLMEKIAQLSIIPLLRECSNRGTCTTL